MSEFDASVKEMFRRSFNPREGYKPIKNHQRGKARLWKGHKMSNEEAVEAPDLSVGMGLDEGLEALGDTSQEYRYNRLEQDPVMINKYKALAELGYGSAGVALNEAIRADEYNRKRGYKTRMVAGAGDELVKVYNLRGGAFAHSGVNSVGNGGGKEEPFVSIDSRVDGDIERNADRLDPVNGVKVGFQHNNKETFGHELTHNLDLYDKSGRGGYENDDTAVGVYSENYSNAGLSYPELKSVEHAPALAALTRHEFSRGAGRIDSPEKYDKKIAVYASKSQEGKDNFKKKLPMEVQRFYNYIDSMEKATKKSWIEFGDPTYTPSQPHEIMKKVYGEDRLKRFHDINRDMIGGLVQNDKPKRFLSVDKMGVSAGGVTGRA